MKSRAKIKKKRSCTFTCKRLSGKTVIVFEMLSVTSPFNAMVLSVPIANICSRKCICIYRQIKSQDSDASVYYHSRNYVKNVDGFFSFYVIVPRKCKKNAFWIEPTLSNTAKNSEPHSVLWYAKTVNLVKLLLLLWSKLENDIFE